MQQKQQNHNNYKQNQRKTNRKTRYIYNYSSSDNRNSSSDKDNRNYNHRYRINKGRNKRNNTKYSNIKICLAAVDEAFNFEEYFNVKKEQTKYNTNSNGDFYDHIGINDNFLSNYDNDKESVTNNKFTGLNNLMVTTDNNFSYCAVPESVDLLFQTPQ